MAFTTEKSRRKYWSMVGKGLVIPGEEKDWKKLPKPIQKKITRMLLKSPPITIQDIRKKILTKTGMFSFANEMEKIAKVSELQRLKQNKKPLTAEERAITMSRKAVWNFGPHGEESPAVWKSVDNQGKTTFVTHTHRAYNTSATLLGAIKRFHDFIKGTA